MTYTIAEPCVDLKDKACIEECPVDCIYEGARMLYIHPDECVDCGACEPVCPVEAIYYEDDVPEQWSQYTRSTRTSSPSSDPRAARPRSARPRTTRRSSRSCRRRPRRLSRLVNRAASAVSASLPEFPWDTLADATALAKSHPGGIVDLSVGTPVDPVAPLIRDALAAASAAPGYPTTAGTPALRESAVAALRRRYGVTGLAEAAVLPVIGTKELIAWLPTLLGLGADDLVVVPELAYPTYDVGARLAGAQVLRRRLAHPARPADAGAGVRELAEQPDRRRCSASSTCASWSAGPASAARWWPPTSATWAWAGTPQPVSVLHPSVCDGDHTGLLAVHSLSKRSSLAGYRAGFVAGDPALVGELLAVRKHAGMMVPRPVQAAMVAALDDDAHEREQRERYRAAPRRAAAGVPCGRLHRRPLRGRAVSLGHPRRAVPRHRRVAGGARHPGGARRVLRRTRRPARAGGADRHRRAHRRRRRPVGDLGAA